MSIDRTTGATQTYATSDLDEARAFMTDEFMGHVPSIRGPFDDFRLRVSSVDHGGFVRHELAHRGAVQSASEPFEGFLVGHLRAGRARFLVGADDVRLSAGDLYLYPQGSGLTTTWISARLDSVMLSSEALDEACAEAGHGRRNFDGVRPRSTALAEQWQRTVDYVDGVSAAIELDSYPLIAHQLSRLLATVLLSTFAHQEADDPPREGLVPSAALRRALNYIEAHAHEPVSLVELARAAGVSPRALQQAFRGQLDTTPIEYARRLRLERAHQDLREGDPTRGDTVADVAARWGFVHHGRFAADFHAAYGRSPRAVLHN